MRVLMAVLLVATALAGCSEAPEVPQEVTEQDIEVGTAAPLPEWSVGMYWEFQHSMGGEPGDVATYVVTDVGSSSYTLDVNNKQTAYYDALWDISFVGEIRKTDLAGKQGSTPVAMFEFPLSHEKTWTTTWDGDQLTMTSMNMGPMQFHVTGKNAAGTTVVDYHYNALKSWFEYITFYNATSGDEAFRMDLKSHGDDFSGQVYRYAVGERRAFVATAQDGQGIQEVDFAAEWNELHGTFDVFCNGDSSGQNLIGINPPEKREENPGPMLPFINEPEYGFIWDCADGPEGSSQAIMPNTGGTWEIGLLPGGSNAVVHVLIEERALETITL